MTDGAMKHLPYCTSHLKYEDPSNPLFGLDRPCDCATMSRRLAFIHSLRDAADFFEAHTDVSMPTYVTMNVFLNSREEVEAHARAASWRKFYNNINFMLSHAFGEDLTLDVCAPRDTVCRKVVTGSHVVPAQPERTIEDFSWECDDALLQETT